MKKPKVSVIIPVYNSEEYLRHCLDSLLCQTFGDFEILCIDDGSTDSSARIIEEYVSSDSRVRLLHQENKGAGAARNYGLRESKGRYLLFLDSDDFFEPVMLEKAYRTIVHYKADFIVFGCDQYYMDTKEYVRNPWVMRTEDIPPYMPFKYRQLTGNVFKTFVGWAWDKMYRKDFVISHNLWFQEQRTSNDLLFVFSALVVAEKIAVNRRVLLHQRRGTGKSLSVTREQSWGCFYDALLAIRKRLEDEDIYWELERDYINYALHFSLWNLKTLAEPTKQQLFDKLFEEWFDELGVTGKSREYFYDQAEYSEYCEYLNKR
ncbi:MAG: glycosyltransferase family 2 protein [Blautia sp.]|nr:glycosyltransferase family 2 protein [Blautia sp.]